MCPGRTIVPPSVMATIPGIGYKARGPPEVEKNRPKPRRVGLCEKYHRSHQLNCPIPIFRKKVGGKASGTKAKPKFKSYAEARKDREKFRKKLVSCQCTLGKSLNRNSREQSDIKW